MGLIGTVLKAVKYAALLVLCFALLADVPVLLFLLNAKATFFEASTYTKALKENNAYSITRDAAVTKGYEMLQQNEELKKFDFPKEKVQLAAKRIFTDAWLESQATSVFSSFFSYLKGDSKALVLNVSLAEIKPRIIPETRDLVDEVFDEQADELIKKGIQIPTGAPCKTLEECEQLCKNPSYAQLCQQFTAQYGLETLSVQELKNFFKKQIEANLSEEINKLPDSIDLAEQFRSDPEMMKSFEQAKNGVKTIFNVLNALLIFTVILILLTLILSFLPFHPDAAMRWVGFPLLASGAVTAAGAYFLPKYLDQSVSQQVPAELAKEALFVLAKNVLFSVLNQLFWNTLVQALVIAALGLILFSCSFFLSAIIHLIKRR